MASNMVSTKEMTLDELRAEYDSIANEYERRIWFDQSILGVARFRKSLISQSQGKIFDVVCGTGLNFPFFPAESNITGIDLSPGMLEVARRNASRLGLNVVVVMDAQKLDFPDQSFNVVPIEPPSGATREAVVAAGGVVKESWVQLLTGSVNRKKNGIQILFFMQHLHSEL